MTDNPTQPQAQEAAAKPASNTQLSPQTDQVMAERLLLETLPKPQPAPAIETPLQKSEGEWPEHLQREIDLAIVTTFFSAGVIGLFLWMGGIF